MHRKLGLSLAVLTLASLTLAGCFQIHKLVSVSLGNLSAVNGASSAGYFVDLESESSVYRDHRDKFDDISDCAVLGTFRNNLSSAVNADVWIVPDASGPGLLPDLAAVQAAGGIRLWTLSLAANETKAIGWNESAALFNGAGKDALKAELAGDGLFALYVFGNTGTYDITVTNATFVAVIAASGFLEN